MALVTRSSNADLDATSAIQAGNKIPRLPGDPLMAGEDLDAVAPCYIKSSDGKVYMANGTGNAGAPDERGEVIGFTAAAVNQGEPVTLFRGNTVFKYSDDFSADGVSAGDRLYVAATAGRLDTAATVSDTKGVAVALDDEHVLVVRADGVSG